MDKELAESCDGNENGDVDSKLTPTQISKLFVGNVRHRRFSPKPHSFNYSLYMLGLDVDQVTSSDSSSSVFSKLYGTQWYKPLRFKQEDYLRGEPGDLKQRIINKISTLGGHDSINKVIMLVQVRCFGLYFSPANFYFAYSNQGNCLYMLVEVSNTPWNKRHYYLVDMANITPTEKDFHVSPFMDLAMQYHWRVSPPNLTEQVDTKPIKSDKQDKLLIHIENISHQQEKLFDATLALTGLPINSKNLMSVMRRFPAMTLTVVTGIYVQALKLFIKRIPFVPYQRKAQKQEL